MKVEINGEQYVRAPEQAIETGIEHKSDEWKRLNASINSNGVMYSVEHYSLWSDIKCARFHELKNALVEAKSNLDQYLLNQGIFNDDY